MTELPIFAAGFLGIEHFTPPWDIFFLPLLNGLLALYKLLFSDFLIAIVVFTIVIRTLLAPLFAKQIRSQKEMQRMQPLVKEVQRKYKGDRQKITAETMALYKEHGVNPASGCLPLLIQMPILLALYQALTRASGRHNYTPPTDPADARLQAFERIQEQVDVTALANNNWAFPVNGPCNLPEYGVEGLLGFLPLNCQLIEPFKLGQAVDTTVNWIAMPWAPGGLDLADVDRVFSFSILGGFVISGLAIVAGLLTFVQAKMAQPTASSGPDQAPDPTMQATATMTYLFPLMYVFWGGIFPSGLIIYWIVYSAYVIAQQYLMMGWGNLFPLFGWTPGFARNKTATALAAAPATSAAAASSGSSGSSGSSRSSGGTSASASSTTRQTKPPARSGSTQSRSASQRRRRGRKAR